MGAIEQFVAAALRQRFFVLLVLAACVATGIVAWRDVVVGGEAEGWVEVRSGVKEGEDVATSGSFLLKSELLKGTLAEEE